jgi:membrane protein YqaA with SNARE-associated domain
LDKQHVKGESRLRSLYQHYKNRGFFDYVGKSILWIVAVYALLILIVFLISRYLIDFNSLFATVIEKLNDRFVLILFFVSESFLGMVPVDLFVVWTQKFIKPLPFLALLGILSYAGAILSYWIGIWISRRPRMKAYSERNLKQYMNFARKWGGAFIIIAALFPFTPFSMVVIALALLKYPFRLLVFYALSRLVRFVIQGVLMFDILQLQNWITG